MPKIQLGEDQLGQQTLTPAGGRAGAGGLDVGVNAIQRLANQGVQTVLAVQENRRQMETARATTDAVKEIDEQTQYFLDQDTDYTTQEQRYGEFYKDLEERYRDKLGDERSFNQFRQNVDVYAYRKGLKVKSNALQQDIESQKTILQSTLSDLSGVAIRGDDKQFQDVVSKSEELLESAFESGVIDTKEKEQFQHAFKNELSRGKVRQDITHDPEQALENIRANEYSNLSAEEQSQFEAMAISAIAQNKNKNAHNAKKFSRELVSDTILSYENGYEVRAEEQQAAEEAAKLVGMEEDLAVARAASEYITLPKSVRDGLPETIKGVNNAELRESLEKADEIVERELNKDGYAFAVRQGIVEEIPLDVQNPETVLARLEQVDYLKSHYGRDISPLTDTEADNLVSMLPAMSPGQKVQLAQAFGSSQAIWEQLDKKNAGTFAMAGAIGDPEVMKTIFIGQQRKADKLVPNISSNDYLPAFDDVVGDVYVGKDRKAMLDAALAYYAGSTDEDTFDADDFEDAIQAVSGGIAKINGSKIELPRGIDEDDFEDYIDNISPDTVSEFGGVWSMSNDAAAEAIRDGRIQSIGANRYTVYVRDALLMRADGSGPFTFGFNQERFEADTAPPTHGERAAQRRRNR